MRVRRSPSSLVIRLGDQSALDEHDHDFVLAVGVDQQAGDCAMRLPAPMKAVSF